MKFFSIHKSFFLIALLTAVFSAACQKSETTTANQNRTIEPPPKTNSNSEPATTDDFCERTYAQILQENEQNFVSCLSDLKVNLRQCPKPDGFDDVYKEKLNVVVALDSSGSMNGKIKGEQKLAIAKRAITAFVNTLPENANVGLIVYGHRGSNSSNDKQTSCQSVEPVYPIQKLNKNEFLTVVNSFNPVGWTPLAGAIDKAGEILNGQTGETVTNLVYVVSDGIETCGGNPVQSATNLHQSNVKAIVNIIGFDVDDAAQQQLKAAAAAGGGEYLDARDADELTKAFGGVSKSVAAYNEYLRCMTANKQDVYRLYGNKENQIFLCISNKSREESEAIRRARMEWSRTKDARDRCAPYVIEHQDIREQRIKDWKNEVTRKIQQTKDLNYDELERELKDVTEEHFLKNDARK